MQFLDVPQSFKNGLVIQSVAPFGPIRFLDQSHSGIVVDGLTSEGGVLDDFANSEEFGRYFKLRFLLRLHSNTLLAGSFFRHKKSSYKKNNIYVL